MNKLPNVVSWRRILSSVGQKSNQFGWGGKSVRELCFQYVKRRDALCELFSAFLNHVAVLNT